MTTDVVTITSRAKINWLLRVGPPRSDGYHELLTIFQELELGEPMTFRALQATECRLSGYPADIPPEKNLVTRAWQLMAGNYPAVRGLDVSIKKSLPQGGGLGGGSSNAACTLKAINALYHLNVPDSELEQLAGQLGSDVSFFIKGGAACGSGRGEILEQLPPSPVYHLVLVFPRERMSTAEGYRLLDEISRPIPSPHTLSTFLTAVQSGSPATLAPYLQNDFELVAKNFNWFSETRTKLQQAGVQKVLLCGSGSTVAGLCENRYAAQRIALHVGGIPTYTWPAS